MKIEQKKKESEFIPTVITLESQAEVNAMRMVLGKIGRMSQSKTRLMLKELYSYLVPRSNIGFNTGVSEDEASQIMLAEDVDQQLGFDK